MCSECSWLQEKFICNIISSSSLIQAKQKQRATNLWVLFLLHLPFSHCRVFHVHFKEIRVQVLLKTLCNVTSLVWRLEVILREFLFNRESNLSVITNKLKIKPSAIDLTLTFHGLRSIPCRIWLSYLYSFKCFWFVQSTVERNQKLFIHCPALQTLEYAFSFVCRIVRLFYSSPASWDERKLHVEPPGSIFVLLNPDFIIYSIRHRIFFCLIFSLKKFSVNLFINLFFFSSSRSCGMH